MANPIFHSQYTAQQIEDEIENGVPRISESTTNWERWDIATQQWVDTGVPADAQEAAERAEAAAESAEEDAESVAAVADAFDDYVAAIYGAYPHDSITDTAVASFTDGAEDIPVKSLTVNIDPVQAEGTPTPESPLPISGWTGANVYDYGANVADTFQYTNGYFISETGAISANASFQYANYIPTIPNMAMHFKVGMGYFSGTYRIRVHEYNANKVWLREKAAITLQRYGTVEADVPISADAVYVQFSVPYVNRNVYEVNIGRLNAVAFPTPPGTVYGGTLTDNGDGTWTLTVDRELLDVNDYSGGWVQVSSGSNKYFRSYTSVADGTKPEALICNTLVNSEVTSSTETENAIYLQDSGKVAVRPESVESMDTTAFVSWLTDTATAIGSHILAVIPIVSPITVQLTAESVKTLLGANRISADCGDIAALTYRADTTLYIDKRLAALGS